MTTTLSTGLLQAMGFRAFAEDEALKASFSSVTVYEVRGVCLAPEITQISSGSVANVTYRLVISASVNDGCSALVDDAFVENEGEWRKENKYQGPFLLVKLGPTAEHVCKAGRIKIDDDGNATTYDCFPGVRTELAELESKALPAIISALACVLSEEGRPVGLRKIERVSSGRTMDGIQVRDIRMEVRAEASTSYNLLLPALAEKLGIAATLASTINQKASRFFALGLAENDQLKRFLYFFLALEVETHATFGRIDHSAGLRKLLDGATFRRQFTVQLLETQVDRLKGLYDRFAWCAACVWTKLDESDIAQFKMLKGARNDIAHGSASEPPLGFARHAELLAHKVLWSAR